MKIKEAWERIKDSHPTDCGPLGREFPSDELEKAMKTIDALVELLEVEETQHITIER